MRFNDYLIIFQKEFNSFISKNKGSLNVGKLFKSRKMVLYKKSDLDYLEFVKELNRILDVFYAIFTKPTFITHDVETVLRSEVAQSIEGESFIQTMNTPSFWKRKRGELQPEYVYNKESEETIDTYENRFVIFVYKIFMEEIANFENLEIFSQDSISNHFQVKEFTLGHNSIYNAFKKEDSVLSDLLFSKEKNYYANLVNDCFKRAKRLRQTMFYRTLKDKDIKLPIILTNIILHDRRYNEIYRYYKDNLTSENNLENMDDMFYNYGLLRILNLYKDKIININSEVKYVDNRLIVEDLELNLTPFVLSLTSTPDGLKLIARANDKSNTTYLNFKYLLNKYNYVKGSRNFYITKINMIKSYANIGELNYFENTDLILENAIKAATLILLIGKEVTFKDCPICKNGTLVYDHGDYHCTRCESIMSMVEIDDVNYLWIKGLWR